MNIDYFKILDVFINEIIPPTFDNVKIGNKIFGGAILNKNDFSTLCIGLNNETSNPLYHGEISTIINFYKNEVPTNPKECFFISTHEPCSLCLSAITWSGFTNFFYFFPYSDTKDKFNIPHDLNILSEVFKLKNGNYKKKNKYCNSYSILDEVNEINSNNKLILNEKIEIIHSKYEELSSIYQLSKNNNNIYLN